MRKKSMSEKSKALKNLRRFKGSHMQAEINRTPGLAPAAFIIIAVLLAAACVLSFPAAPATGENDPAPLFKHDMEHCSEEGIFEMRDVETGETIMRTARPIYRDDEYIDQQNRLYRVERVEENVAWARYLETVELPVFPMDETAGAGTAAPGSTGKSPQQQAQEDLETPQPGDIVIGVYHSHGAEAYLPSDGDEFIEDGGGILEVGESFVRSMEDRGFEVNYSQETHVPHDAGAYHRSRRTVEELLKDDSTVLFDIHRDAVPGEEYVEVVEGQPTVQVQLVVGRQNENMEVNREFAEGLKRASDEQHPGLVKGIFMARGNYNQDMLPQSMLLEIGTHENTREGAERSVELFSDSVEFYLVGAEGPVQDGIGGAVLRSILWIVLIAAAAAGIFLLVSTGSRDELRRKIQDFFGREFGDLKGRFNEMANRRGRRGDNPGDESGNE